MARPDVLPECKVVLSCFDDLALDRPVGMALGAIPWTAVRTWAEAHGWDDPDDLAFLSRGVRLVDGLWLEKHRPHPPAS